MRYSPWTGMKYFGFNQAEHEFCSCWPPCPEVWILLTLPWITSTPAFRNDVNQLVDASGVSRDWTRREDNSIAGLELYLTVGSVGDTRESCHWFTLTTCTEDQNLACRIVFDFIWLDKGSFRSFDVTKFDSVDNGFSIERPKTAILRPVLTAASVACWRRKIFEAKDAKMIRPFNALDNLHDGLTNNFSELVKVGTSAFVESDRETENAFFPKGCHTVQVRRFSNWCKVKLEVTRTNDFP